MMLSRRDFLKSIGLSGGALGAGFVADAYPFEHSGTLQSKKGILKLEDLLILDIENVQSLMYKNGIKGNINNLNNVESVQGFDGNQKLAFDSFISVGDFNPSSIVMLDQEEKDLRVSNSVQNLGKDLITADTGKITDGSRIAYISTTYDTSDLRGEKIVGLSGLIVNSRLEELVRIDLLSSFRKMNPKYGKSGYHPGITLLDFGKSPNQLLVKSDGYLYIAEPNKLTPINIPGRVNNASIARNYNGKGTDLIIADYILDNPQLREKHRGVYGASRGIYIHSVDSKIKGTLLKPSIEKVAFNEIIHRSYSAEYPGPKASGKYVVFTEYVTEIQYFRGIPTVPESRMESSFLKVIELDENIVNKINMKKPISNLEMEVVQINSSGIVSGIFHLKQI